MPAFGEWSVEAVVPNPRWKENCYLVRRAGEITVIDPGGEVELGEGTLRRILLTHAHFDHVAGVAALRRRCDVPVYLHEDDARLLLQAPTYALRFGGERMEPAGAVTPEAPDGVEVLHTPGHTDGSVCYCFPGFVFCGDLLFREGTGRTDLPGGNAAKLAASISRVLEGQTEEMVLFPGHGRPWTVGEARRWWGERTAT